MKLSIVTTLYSSAPYVEEFYDRITKSAKKITKEFEIIFVNDGSPDNVLEIVIDLHKIDSRVRVVDLSRNFGHHYAAFAGIKYSKGDLVYITDCDLEVAPETIVKFYDVMTNEEIDVVYGFQKNRKGRFIENIAGSLFWKTINLLSDFEIPINIVTERLMTRNYVDELLTLGDRNLFLGGMMHWTGFNQKGIQIVKGDRKEKSTYSTIKRFALMLEAVTSFSTFPLKLSFYSGLIFSLAGFSIGTFLFFQKILYPEQYLSGYVSIVGLIILVFGIIEMSVGFLGLYLAKIFKQVQNRPLYIIKKIY
jgi:putative glycosyltransferase